MHAKHHAKKVQRATEAIRLSAGDQILDVGCSIAALNIVQAHPLSRSVYNAVIVYLLIELHSGAVSYHLTPPRHPVERSNVLDQETKNYQHEHIERFHR
jgi:hypothetical protein